MEVIQQKLNSREDIELQKDKDSPISKKHTESIAPTFISQLSDHFSQLRTPNTHFVSIRRRIEEHLENISSDIPIFLREYESRTPNEASQSFFLPLHTTTLSPAEYEEFLNDTDSVEGDKINNLEGKSTWSYLKSLCVQTPSIHKKIEPRVDGWLGGLLSEVKNAIPESEIHFEVRQSGFGGNTKREIRMCIVPKKSNTIKEDSKVLPAKLIDYLPISEEAFLCGRERILAACGFLALCSSIRRMDSILQESENLEKLGLLRSVSDWRINGTFGGLLGLGVYFSVVIAVTDGLKVESIMGDLLMVALITNAFSGAFELGRMMYRSAIGNFVKS